MNIVSNQVYYFCFGYHHPDVWEVARGDRDFDCESTAVLPISAEDEAAAFVWGQEVAAWYMRELSVDFPGLEYQWSCRNYRCWMEAALPEGFEVLVQNVGKIDVNSYPRFELLRRELND